MRILAASTGGAGHFGPMVPFLRAAVAAGHEVLVAAPESVRPRDLPFTALPDSPPEKLGAVFGSVGSLPRAEANARVIGEVFGTINVDSVLPTLESLVGEWRPDVVVREVAEFGSYVAATRADVPQVQVAIGLRSFEEFAVGVLGDGFAERYGVAAAPLLDLRTLSLMPRSLELSVAGRERFRDDAVGPSGAPLPEAGDDRPLVYVTFGSVAATMPPFRGVYRAALDALADLPVRVLMTVGSAGDPEALAPLPPNARVERWVPQADVLPHARVVVGHGGFGTTLGALAAGVPLVTLPLFSYDQFQNADAVAAVGAGVVAESPDSLGAAVAGLLDDERVRAAARDVAVEVAALPPAADWLP